MKSGFALMRNQVVVVFVCVYAYRKIYIRYYILPCSQKFVACIRLRLYTYETKSLCRPMRVAGNDCGAFFDACSHDVFFLYDDVTLSLPRDDD